MWSNFLEEQSIFSLFPGKVLQSLDIEKYIFQVERNEILVEQGQVINDLIIPLDVSLLLRPKKSSNTEHILGTVAAGRSVNLYGFLRYLPSQYSVVCDGSGTILRLPKEYVEKLFLDYPNVKIYLKRITESALFKSLIKEIQSTGVSQLFVVEFFSALNEVTFEARSIIDTPDTISRRALFLVDGEFSQRHGKFVEKAWLVPLRSWLNWENCILLRKSSVTVTTMARSTCLEISRENLLKLQVEFNEDFEKLNDWILSNRSGIELDEEDEDVENLEALFKGALDDKRKFLWKYPTVLQGNEMDCGPACLSMISQFFGKNLSIHFWRSRLSTDKDGTSLYDLANTSEKAGFISHCLRVENIKEVDPYLVPFIVLRQYHYMVVYKIKSNSVVLGDPGVGIREISYDEFNKGFENAGLFLKPTIELYGHPDSSSSWKHYLFFMHGLKKEFSFALACALMGVIVNLAPPILTQYALDEVLVLKDLSLLYWIIIGAAGLALLSGFFSWAEHYYYTYIMSKLNFRMTSVFMQKMLSLPFNFFASHHVGDFTNRYAQMSRLRNFISTTVFNFILDVFTMVVYAGALLLMSPKLAILAFLICPVILVFPYFSQKVLNRLYNQIFTKSSEQQGFLMDIVKGISAIKTQGAEYSMRHRFELGLLDQIKTNQKFELTANAVRSMSYTYYQIGMLLLMAAAIYLSVKGEISAGMVISISLIASKFFAPMYSIAKYWEQFIEVKSIMSFLDEIFLTNSDQSTSKNISAPADVKPLRGEIEFRDVWFRYGGEAADWTLKGVNFKILPGEKVAIVGPSGSGKSTIASLLTRMHEPTKGQIFVDGRDYREYPLGWYRSQVGLLPQENFLFGGTVAENISLGSLESNETQLETAAKRADANFIFDKPGGLEGHVPYGGFGFSGGEKQKISLARMFFQNPSVIVLDEATSALDGIAEAEVLAHIKNELKNNTTLNIAHRFSTVCSSDLALVVKDGKIVGTGPIPVLSEQNKTFRELFNLTDTNDYLAFSKKKAS